jgi:hypothetical protein
MNTLIVLRSAGPGGWSDLDSIDVGNGYISGLTNDERRSYITAKNDDTRLDLTFIPYYFLGNLCGAILHRQ